MATATKRALATNGDTTGSGYSCPSSSVAAAMAVRKDDKVGSGLFVWCRDEKIGLCIFSISMFGKEAVCLDGHFVPAIFQELGFYLNSLI